jgi:hypothetical protein
MKDEGKLWFRARRDAAARGRLRKAYISELLCSLGLLAGGIVLVFFREAFWIPESLLMIAVGMIGAVFGWIQLSRIEKMQTGAGGREGRQAPDVAGSPQARRGRSRDRRER